jgi:hypothetical protein
MAVDSSPGMEFVTAGDVTECMSGTNGLLVGSCIIVQLAGILLRRVTLHN